jgi:hypothetical protein
VSKLSKTARQSLGKAEKKLGPKCPLCQAHMVATRIIGRYGIPGGMFWMSDCGYREKIGRK